MYRVNFGNGHSHKMHTRKEATAYLAAVRASATDPRDFACSFVERRIADGEFTEWVRIK